MQIGCIFIQARPQHCEPRFPFAHQSPGSRSEEAEMKFQRHSAIRELVAHSLVSNQDELRRKLRRRGFEVTQATLSRDIHELRLSKGPGGYVLPNGNGSNGAAADVDDSPPSVAEMI